MKRDLQLDLDPATLAAPGRPAREWRQALPLVVLMLLWVLGWYAGTAKSMADIWARSDTFAHGFLVPVISLWLVWRRREELAAMTPQPAWWALPPLAGIGFLWFMAELAAVNAVSQFALTALLVLTVVALVGTAVARRIAFPLAFLFFAVPVGEVLLPKLMEWTADFTAFGLRLSGVPVYREGQQLVIPTGVWSVIEACSGLRYLIASLMIGTLFAYLMYRSTKRRLMFVGVALLVPIVANWLRAYMIVMLGHLSGNKIAVGVDHFIYGWVFFGIVIGCMFWIGAVWREDHLPEPASPGQRFVASRAPRGSTALWSVAIATAALIAVWKLGYFVVERSDAATLPHLVSPEAPPQWQRVDHEVAAWRPHFENPSAESQQTYSQGGQKVGLIIAYYRHQDRTSKLVSSENTLIRSSADSAWWRVRGGTQGIDYNGNPLAIRETELRGVNGQRLEIWQWYWINGRLTASDYWAKGYVALSRLMGQGDDSASVLVYTAAPEGARGQETLQAFVRAAAPAIEAALRQTRDTR